MTLVNFTIVLFGVLLNALGQIALKAGAKKIGYIGTHSDFFSILQSAINTPIFLGLFCYAASVTVWIIALSRVPVSTAYPMLSLGYIVVSLLAYLLFNEPISFHKFIAITVIIFGVYLLGKS